MQNKLQRSRLSFFTIKTEKEHDRDDSVFHVRQRTSLSTQKFSLLTSLVCGQRGQITSVMRGDFVQTACCYLNPTSFASLFQKQKEVDASVRAHLAIWSEFCHQDSGVERSASQFYSLVTEPRSPKAARPRAGNFCPKPSHPLITGRLILVESNSAPAEAARKCEAFPCWALNTGGMSNVFFEQEAHARVWFLGPFPLALQCM